MSKRLLPTINAGSMADIAFLLLIFFLVTTTIESDKGIYRKLPELNDVKAPFHERNVMEISINALGEVWVEDTILPLDELTDIAIAFIDNGGITDTAAEYFCAYCKGDRNKTSSDHPKKAVFAITTHREAIYKDFIAVQDRLSAAYNILRDRASQHLYNFEFTVTKAAINDGSFNGNIATTKEALRTIQDMYPLNIAEVENKQRL